jgi:predicted regulator of Ras-like GTPase activity (Roadblock/LC7/MglB family)
MEKRMKKENRREQRLLILLGFFLAVVPLAFFPNDLGVKIDTTPFLVFPFEMLWYFLVYLLLFSELPVSVPFLYGLITLGLRLLIGAVFGMLLYIMFPLETISLMNVGIFTYFPALLIQATLLPFVVKISLGNTIEESWKERKRPKKVFLSSFQPSEEKKDIIAEKPEKIQVDLEAALDYVKEYSGVEGVILLDQEGLVVANRVNSGWDEEEIAPLALLLRKINSRELGKIDTSPVERMELLSQKLWISLNNIGGFTLVSLAHRSTDELLNIRILKAVEMIRKYLDEKYAGLFSKNQEVENVPDLRRA